MMNWAAELTYQVWSGVWIFLGFLSGFRKFTALECGLASSVKIQTCTSHDTHTVFVYLGKIIGLVGRARLH